ncbi:hypothetical protein EJB05_13314, partial [Eragrostis curvula]
MLCRPCFGDQMGNARYVDHVWRVGVELNGDLERGKVQAAIETLMGGAELRRNARELKSRAAECMATPGTSSTNVDKLLGPRPPPHAAVCSALAPPRARPPAASPRLRVLGTPLRRELGFRRLPAPAPTRAVPRTAADKRLARPARALSPTRSSAARRDGRRGVSVGEGVAARWERKMRRSLGELGIGAWASSVTAAWAGRHHRGGASWSSSSKMTAMAMGTAEGARWRNREGTAAACRQSRHAGAP